MVGCVLVEKIRSIDIYRAHHTKHTCTLYGIWKATSLGGPHAGDMSPDPVTHIWPAFPGTNYSYPVIDSASLKDVTGP